jgi:hypothetical protein
MTYLRGALALALATATASGCGAIYYSRPEVLRQQTTEWLCSSYPGERVAVLAGGPTIATAIRAELDKRGAMSDLDWLWSTPTNSHMA